MAHQTVLNDNKNGSKTRSNGLMDNVSSFGNDLASLATLQTKLAAADLRESLQKAAPAIGGLVVLSLLAIAGMTAIVAGFAMWLADALKLQLGVAFMLTGLGCIVLGALLAWLCIRFLGSSFTAFRRSGEEFERNLAWIKTTLTRSGR